MSTTDPQPNEPGPYRQPDPTPEPEREPAHGPTTPDDLPDVDETGTTGAEGLDPDAGDGDADDFE